MICLIDGDILVYRAGYAAQKKYYRFIFHDDRDSLLFKGVTVTEVKSILKAQKLSKVDGRLQSLLERDKLSHCLHTVKVMIEQILKSLGSLRPVLYLTANDKSNYRFDIAVTKPYKGTRKQSKPFYYDDIREYLMSRWDAKIVSGEEADDTMSRVQYKRTQQGKFDTCICTIDKDLDMVPGWHFNFVTCEKYFAKDPGEVSLSDDGRKLRGTGLKWFYAQLLLGDNADNIPGLRGIGPVTAFHLLEKAKSEDEMLKIVYELYKKKKVLKRLCEVVDLLWMRRHKNEFKSHDIKARLHRIKKEIQHVKNIAR